jgi:GTP-dependent phosphoenolpyruvate carboxykinase
MSKFLRENIFNILIFLLLSIQVFMYYYDNSPSYKVFSQKSMSVENFSSIVLSKSGLTKIGSEKLNKIDEDNFFFKVILT